MLLYCCGQKSHVQRGCRNPPIGYNSLQQLGNGNGPLMRAVSVLEALIGEANEAVAYLNNHPCLVLLDTSQVMLISQQFYQEHLSVWPMQSLKGLVHVVRAAGQMVPFLGYGEQSISFPRTKAGTDKVFQMLVLVVQDNHYNQSVPLILGTNLAKQCQDICQQMGGLPFLQRMAVSRVWK